MRAALFLVLCSSAFAETIAITNARIFPVTSPAIDRGTVVIVDGKITAVGQKVQIPGGARRIDATGLSVYPGWIDGFSRVGLEEIAGVTPTVDVQELGPFNPAAQAWIAVNPHAEMVKTTRVNGVTTALVAPAGNIISGTASLMNLHGLYPSDMAIVRNAGVIFNIPSIYRFGPGPPGETADARRQRIATNMEKLRQFLREAKRYADLRQRSGGTVAPSALDTTMEAMVPVMRGERPAICTADHFRDIRAAVELGDEFGLKILIAGGADAWKMADLLAKKKVGVLYSGVHEMPRTADDPYDVTFTTPETLRRAGVPFAIVSDASSDARNLPYRASMAAAYGLEREDALKSITLWPAQMLGIADKVGSIEAGKLANLLVSKGDPLDVRSEIRYVMIEGRLVPAANRNVDLYEQFRQPAR